MAMRVPFPGRPRKAENKIFYISNPSSKVKQKFVQNMQSSHKETCNMPCIAVEVYRL